MSRFLSVGALVVVLAGCSKPCKTSAQCDDGRACNGEETCVNDVCVEGAAPVCDDGIACTVDRCDEGSRRCVAIPIDRDDDGYGDLACRGADGGPLGDDCDDANGDRFPGNAETCRTPDDDDCDPSTVGYQDDDRDGYVSSACRNSQPDGGVLRGPDCDDTKEAVHPGQAELCNFADDNCNGVVDEGVSSMRFKDDDNDGWGTGPGAMGCVGPFTSHLGTDCDDLNPAMHPGAFRCTTGTAGNLYELCTVDGGFVTGACPGQSCRPQPNGTGICL